MSGQTLNLNGYTDVPEGKIAFVVTCLEMLEGPSEPLASTRKDVTLERWTSPSAEDYCSMFRQVGEEWLWFGRLTLERETLDGILREPTREFFRPMINGKPVGLLEIDYADPASPELSYFGLTADAIGGGIGRWLMAQAVEMVWSRPESRRFWVHTCTGDSPQALRFYMSCGFKPYKRSIEVADDPRLSGVLPKDKGAHVPIIE
ncbi:GNAT family N-acetyltransferase [Roseibium sp. SCP14]|uniref:GNAT family N-acetyltransferase n=1 Tax=Roseibium sp. SCP14 TaxID=3141375 RepID=UPI0033392DE0